MSLNEYERRFRDHLAGYTDSVYAKLEQGEDLSLQYPNETQVYNSFKNRSESINESSGFTRLND